MNNQNHLTLNDLMLFDFRLNLYIQMYWKNEIKYVCKFDINSTQNRNIFNRTMYVKFELETFYYILFNSAKTLTGPKF